MQLPPSANLSGIVRHYLLLESEWDIRQNYRLFSDGNPGIVFHLGEPLIQYRGNYGMLPRSFIYGQISQYNDVLSTGKFGILVVVLQPYGIYSLLGIGASEFNDCNISLTEIFGSEALDLEDQLLFARDHQSKIAIIEEFLLSKAQDKVDPDSLFKEALQVIYKCKGAITIEELLKKIPITERQLERKFKQYVGTAPKRYAEIIKFQHFLKRLQTHAQGEKISDIVYDSGYYDHSHLNGFFKKITGITPNQYKHNHQLLAVNFMQLP
jgi:AraC-like DNA-binding protein